MSGRILGGDAITRRVETWHTEPDGSVVVASQQDVEDVVEAVKEARKNSRGHRGDMVLKAHIPTVVYEDLIRRGIAGDPDRFKAWLNSEEGQTWHTLPGRV